MRNHVDYLLNDALHIAPFCSFIHAAAVVHQQHCVEQRKLQDVTCNERRKVVTLHQIVERLCLQQLVAGVAQARRKAELLQLVVRHAVRKRFGDDGVGFNALPFRMLEGLLQSRDELHEMRWSLRADAA